MQPPERLTIKRGSSGTTEVDSYERRLWIESARPIAASEAYKPRYLFPKLADTQTQSPFQQRTQLFRTGTESYDLVFRVQKTSSRSLSQARRALFREVIFRIPMLP